MDGQRHGREPVELDDADAALYTIGQVARMLGVPVTQAHERAGTGTDAP